MGRTMRNERSPISCFVLGPEDRAKAWKPPHHLVLMGFPNVDTCRVRLPSRYKISGEALASCFGGNITLWSDSFRVLCFAPQIAGSTSVRVTSEEAVEAKLYLLLLLLLLLHLLQTEFMESWRSEEQSPKTKPYHVQQCKEVKIRPSRTVRNRFIFRIMGKISGREEDLQYLSIVNGPSLLVISLEMKVRSRNSSIITIQQWFFSFWKILLVRILVEG